VNFYRFSKFVKKFVGLFCGCVFVYVNNGVFSKTLTEIVNDVGTMSCTRQIASEPE